MPSPPLHGHLHHGASHTEANLSASGLTWNGKEWVSDEEAVEAANAERAERGEVQPETSSEQTAIGNTEKAEEKEFPPLGARLSGRISVPANVVWIDWEENDRENPFLWSSRKKWTTTWICCICTMVVAWVGASFPIGNASLLADLKCSHELAVMGLSAFPLGFAMGPLFLAPLSEAYGRYPMYVYSNIICVIFFIPTALAKNITTVIVARLINGICASTGSTMVGGTIADIFESHNRGLPMSLFSVMAFSGTGFGPALMGYVELRWGWRWIQWIQMIVQGILTLLIILFTQETRGSVILSRRAAKMRKETGEDKWQCRSDAERASLIILVKVSLTRPLYLLFTEAIVAAFSLWIGFGWGILYLALEAVPLVMENVYGFNAGETGLTFYALLLASAIGFLSNFYQEKLYQRHVATRGPEARLFAACIGGLLFPAGMFIFAFSQGRGHWMGPVIGMVVMFLGIFTIYLAVFNYLADCYSVYASSALSGQSLCRNLAGCAFPLFTTQMYARLGYQWATFLGGCLALLLAMIPFILLAYGSRIRAASKFAKELARMQQKK